MKKFLLLIFITILYSEEFITNLEYGEMLYKNPRGIGCIKCHKKNAKGGIIATIYDNQIGKKKLIIAPNIQKIEWEDFYNRIKKSEKGGKKIRLSFMPEYNYLLDEEIKAIFNYIKIRWDRNRELE